MKISHRTFTRAKVGSKPQGVKFRPCCSRKHGSNEVCDLYKSGHLTNPQGVSTPGWSHR